IIYGEQVMSNVDLNDPQAMLQFTQKRRVALTTEIVDGKSADKIDDKQLRIARHLMNHNDKSVLAQQRLDLEKQSQQSDEEHNQLIGSIIERVLGGGGAQVLTEDELAARRASAPEPKLDALPPATFAPGETAQGSENIEYEDVVKAK
ncbi:hypothetical protein ABN224_21485, partial [Providencia rettgeri]